MSRPSPSPDFTLRGSDGAVTCLTFDGDVLFSGTQSGTLYAWCLRSRRPMWTVESHAKLSVLMIAPLSVQRILSQGRDGLVHVWQLRDGQPPIKTASFKSDHHGFCAACVITFNGKESVIIPTDNRSEITLKDIASAKTAVTLSPRNKDPKGYGMVMSLRNFTQNNRQLLLVGYEDGRVVLWDLLSQSELSSLSISEESVMCVDYSSRINRGVAASVGADIHLFSLSGDLQLLNMKIVEVTNPGFQSAVIRDDAKLVATGGWDGRVRLFSAKTLKPLAVLCGHTEGVQCTAFSPDHTLATGSKDKTISLWSIYK